LLQLLQCNADNAHDDRPRREDYASDDRDDQKIATNGKLAPIKRTKTIPIGKNKGLRIFIDPIYLLR
jgi:hypothetical protein